MRRSSVGIHKKNKLRIRRSLWLLGSIIFISLWILFIWSMSAQSYQQQTIQPFLHKLSEQVRLGFTLPDISINYGEKHYSLQQKPFDFLEFIIRKSGHLFIYAVLAALVYGTLHQRKLSSKTAILFALFVVSLIASTDEYIQQFSPNRTASIRDVGVDLVGGCVGIILFRLSRRVSKGKSKT
ncbi:VanZ family protein [Paenibacillus taichungensis]